VGYHGASVEALETGFHEAFDNYLAACTKLLDNNPINRFPARYCFVRICFEYNWFKRSVFEGQILEVIRAPAASCNQACQFYASHAMFKPQTAANDQPTLRRHKTTFLLTLGYI
jgi:hypothetical protein